MCQKETTYKLESYCKNSPNVVIMKYGTGNKICIIVAVPGNSKTRCVVH